MRSFYQYILTVIAMALLTACNVASAPGKPTVSAQATAASAVNPDTTTPTASGGTSATAQGAAGTVAVNNLASPTRDSNPIALTATKKSGSSIITTSKNPVVYSGGTSSLSGVIGMHDLAVDTNTANYRKLGGKLYVHETGWGGTSEADRQAIVKLFPASPIFETAQSTLVSALKSQVVPYWSAGAYVTCVNVSTGNGVATVVDMLAMRQGSIGLTQYVGQFYSPNDGTSFNTPFSDQSWDDLRTGATVGGALCIDAPPQYYLNSSAAYQQWTADEVAWATANGVVTVFVLFPAQGGDFWQDTASVVTDQSQRGAVPTIWAVNGYYEITSAASYPLGDEADPGASMYTALQLAAQSTGGTFTKNGNSGTASCNAFCAGSQYTGATGACIGGVLSSGNQSFGCTLTPGQLSSGQLTCTCNSAIAVSAPAATTLLKGGNNGTVSCDTYCTGSQWGGWNGTCSGAVIAATNQAINCGTVPGYLSGDQLTCACIVGP